MKNALQTNRKLIGSVLIPDTTGDQTLFRFCRNRISDTGDLPGLDFLNPKENN